MRHNDPSQTFVIIMAIGKSHASQILCFLGPINDTPEALFIRLGQGQKIAGRPPCPAGRTQEHGTVRGEHTHQLTARITSRAS